MQRLSIDLGRQSEGRCELVLTTFMRSFRGMNGVKTREANMPLACLRQAVVI